MSDQEVVIRKGVKEDLPDVLDCIKELAAYEKAPHEVETTLKELERDGFGPDPIYGLYVAMSGKELLGIALYYFKYSTWKGRCLFLEDIVVREAHRRKGIGGMLFDTIVELAKEKGVRRLEWQVLDWNTPAIRFYEKYQAQLDPEWLNGKLVYDQLQNFRRKR